MKEHKIKSNTVLQTPFTKMMGAKYPIIAGPMFLVSDEKLVAASCRAGIVGGLPSLNWRTTEAFRAALKTIKSEVGDLPFAVNIIVNKSNLRASPDIKACLDMGVPMYVTSLGSPKEVITEGHKNGAKVFCDVTTLEHAKKVQDMGADGVIAVSSGAGGHAGPVSPLVLIPFLKKHLSIPIIAAGGIANGRQVAAALVLGASGVQIGTRFIATTECKVDENYKKAIVNADPEDIVLTSKITGTPAAVIRTPYVDKLGLDLNAIEKVLLANETTKKWFKLLMNVRGARMLQVAAKKATWKEVWSAGQGVGLIDSIESIEKIVDDMVAEAEEVLQGFSAS